MNLSNTNNHLISLISAGNDAQAHMYEVDFEGGYFTDIATSMSVRCEGFTPPPQSQDKYTVKYVTAYIDRPKTKITVTRNFKLKFRLDDNYILYKALLEQRKLTANPAKSYANSDISSLMEKGLLFNVKVNLIKGFNDTLEEEAESDESTEKETYNVLRLFNFKNCWIQDISAPVYGDSADPISVEATINFLQMEDWQSGLTGDPDHGQKINA